MGTTDVVMDHQKKKDLQRKFISPELCDITERLVYTEPYNDEQGRNNVFAPNAGFSSRRSWRRRGAALRGCQAEDGLHDLVPRV